MSKGRKRRDSERRAVALMTQTSWASRNWTRAKDAASKMPPGHVAHRQAQELVEKEYAACRELEKKLMKRYKGPKSFSIQDAQVVCNQICDAIGLSQVKVIVGVFEGNMRFAGAFYSNRTIHVRSNQVAACTLFHELAHHVHRAGGFPGYEAHGEGFLSAETLVFEVLFEQPQILNL